MNRDELDRERPVPGAPSRRARWRPASTSTVFTDELDQIFGGIRDRMVRGHVERSRRRALDEGLLTGAELAALRAHGVIIEPTYPPAAAPLVAGRLERAVVVTGDGPLSSGPERADPPAAASGPELSLGL